MGLKTVTRLVFLAVPLLVALTTSAAVVGSFDNWSIALLPGQVQTFGEWPTLDNRTELTFRLNGQNLAGIRAVVGQCMTTLVFAEGDYRLPETSDGGDTFTLFGRNTQDFVIGLMTACGAVSAVSREIKLVEDGPASQIQRLSSDEYFSESLLVAEATAVHYFSYFSGLSHAEYASLARILGHAPMSRESYRNSHYFAFVQSIGLRGLPLKVN